MLEINQQPVWFSKTGPDAVLPDTDFRVKSALRFAGEMLIPMQSSVLGQSSPSCGEWSTKAGCGAAGS